MLGIRSTFFLPLATGLTPASASVHTQPVPIPFSRLSASSVTPHAKFAGNWITSIFTGESEDPPNKTTPANRATGDVDPDLLEDIDPTAEGSQATPEQTQEAIHSYQRRAAGKLTPEQRQQQMRKNNT